MQQRPRNIPVRTMERMARMGYDEALDAFNSSTELDRPTTRAARASRVMRSRATLGVNKDWKKGRHGTSSRDGAGTAGSGSHAGTVDRIRARTHEMYSRVTDPSYALGIAQNVGLENPPCEADITEVTHVILLPTGRRIMPELWRLSFQNLMRVLRERENKSQTDMAAIAGVTQPAICHMESGKTAPRLDTLARILDGLSLSTREFDLVCLRLCDVVPQIRLASGFSVGALGPRKYSSARRAGRPVKKVSCAASAADAPGDNTTPRNKETTREHDGQQEDEEAGHGEHGEVKATGAEEAPPQDDGGASGGSGLQEEQGSRPASGR